MHNKRNRGKYENGITEEKGNNYASGNSKTVNKSTNLKSNLKSKSQNQFVKGGNYSNEVENKSKNETKKTLEQVLRMQTIETQKQNAKEMALLDEQ